MLHNESSTVHQSAFKPQGADVQSLGSRATHPRPVRERVQHGSPLRIIVGEKDANLLVIRAHIFHATREPLKGRLPRLEDGTEVLWGILDCTSNDRALFGESTELDGVAWPGEVDEGPASEVCLLSGRRPDRTHKREWSGCMWGSRGSLHDTMEVGLQKAAAEDRHGISDIADGVAGDGLHVLPLVCPRNHDLESSEPVVEE